MGFSNFLHINRQSSLIFHSSSMASVFQFFAVTMVLEILAVSTQGARYDSTYQLLGNLLRAEQMLAQLQDMDAHIGIYSHNYIAE